MRRSRRASGRRSGSGGRRSPRSPRPTSGSRGSAPPGRSSSRASGQPTKTDPRTYACLAPEPPTASPLHRRSAPKSLVPRWFRSDEIRDEEEAKGEPAAWVRPAVWARPGQPPNRGAPFPADASPRRIGAPVGPMIGGRGRLHPSLNRWFTRTVHSNEALDTGPPHPKINAREKDGGPQPVLLLFG